jgi:hypothetical protein
MGLSVYFSGNILIIPTLTIAYLLEEKYNREEMT